MFVRYFSDDVNWSAGEAGPRALEALLHYNPIVGEIHKQMSDKEILREQVACLYDKRGNAISYVPYAGFVISELLVMFNLFSPYKLNMKRSDGT